MENYLSDSNSKRPAVSVVIPNYNYSKYLDGRISSILSQTFTDYELILLDDASTDNSVEILNRYKDNPHVARIVVNEKNSGSPFAQWKKGIDLAKGKWIWIAEADDLADPSFLETCYRYAEALDNVAFCNADSKDIDSDGNPIPHREKKYRFDNAEAIATDGRSFAQHWMVWENPVVNASGVLFRKDFALAITDHSWMQLRYAGDWVFWFEMAKQGTVVKIQRKQNLYRHRTSQTQTGINSVQSIAENFRVVCKIMNTLPTLSRFEKALIKGKLLRRIGHLKKKELRITVQKSYIDTFGSYSAFDKWLFKIIKLLHFLPFIPSEKNYKFKDGAYPLSLKNDNQ